MDKNSTLLKNLLDAYVGESNNLESSFMPRFIYNSRDKDNPKKVFDTLRENLENCDEFMFSVAFINDSGLNLFKQVFLELQEKNPQIKGRIITSNYLSFTEPKALRELSTYKNIEVRMYYINEGDKIGFHTKGYIFKYKNEQYKVVIGSSNITQSALTSNNEWNNLIVSTKDGEIIKNILNEYERMWDKSLSLENVLDKYEKEYNENKERIRKIQKNGGIVYKTDIIPNTMQKVFIDRLNESINNGDKKGLLISATGTGKTYASALGVKSIKQFKVNKLLFITHRETILKQAIKTFENVFNGIIKTGLYSGSNHDLNGENFIFSTISTIGKEKYLNEFKPDEFDFIIIDECHRIGEKTMYQKVLSYFAPKYFLGMSATPDRSDGYDVYNSFNHNILYEIRLNDALDANMLVPFHYFGICDLIVDGKTIDDNADFRYLTSEERVKHILKKSKYYGYSGDRLKCLLFVSRKDEGKELARKINLEGVKCRYLDGETKQEDREKAIDLLEEDDPNKDYIEMIVTIDVFNEGVDIPSVNQVIFLRPTKSSIIFIQQLGRGLRLNLGKEYLTLIDFIGNYDNNYLIPETFSTKGSGKKRGERAIHPLTPGASVVQFDEVSKKRIIESFAKIPNTKFRRVKEQYIDAKNKLGRIPTLIEFDKNGIISGRSFLDLSSKIPSYYEFLRKINDEKEILTEQEKDTIKYLSKNIGSGLRIHEALLLKTLLNGGSEKDFSKVLLDVNPNYIYDDVIKKSMLSVLDTKFTKTVSTKTKEIPICDLKNKEFQLTNEFINLYKNPVFKNYTDMIVDYALYSQKEYFSKINDYKNNFVLYEKYTRKDVCYLINNLKDESSTVYGYKLFKTLKILPLFVTYQKSVDEDSSTNYADRFINKFLFSWDSKSNRTLKSQEIEDVIKFLKTDGCKTFLFIKRNDVINKSAFDENGEGREIDKDGSFYFLGEVYLESEPKEEQIGKTKKTNVVRFLLHLKTPVKDEIYEYLIQKPLVI